MVTFSENCAPTFRKNVAEADIVTSNFFKSLQSFWSQPPLLLLERVFLPLRGLAVAASSETDVFTSRWYEVEQIVLIPNLSETLEDFWSHSSVFALEKYSKSLSFKSIFTTKKTLVATFSETCRPISKIYVASQGIMMPKLLETFQCFRSHFSLFALEKYS